MREREWGDRKRERSWLVKGKQEDEAVSAHICIAEDGMGDDKQSYNKR